ncbi:unnamed protein product [marine sediment metagenome]|uniref:Uncharacterized protein n=1 Tax=marine sediment metagenome TaxID=412755 RepID=X1JV99_9ZZZZ
MKNENLIHVKLEYGEALQSKRDVLSSEMNLLRITGIIKKYRILRLEELKIKSKLYRKIKEVITNMRNTQTTLPKLKIPEILKKTEETEKPELQIKEKQYDGSLGSQLQEIQDKLNSLQK